jgi:hypothetical protein
MAFKQKTELYNIEPAVSVGLVVVGSGAGIAYNVSRIDENSVLNE